MVVDKANDYYTDFEPHGAANKALTENMRNCNGLKADKISASTTSISRPMLFHDVTKINFNDYPIEQVQAAAEKAKKKVIELAESIINSIAKRTEVHRTAFQHAPVITWKPKKIVITKNLFPDETLNDTPRKPLS